MYLSQTYKILYESRLSKLSAKITLIVQKHAKWRLLAFNKKLFVSWKLCYCAYFFETKDFSA